MFQIFNGGASLIILFIVLFLVILPVVLYLAKNLKQLKNFKEEFKRNEVRWSKAETIGGIGYWEYDVRREKFLWSNVNYKIFGQDPGEGEPGLEQFLSTVHRDDRSKVGSMLSNSIRDKKKFDFEFRVIPDDNIVYVRAIGEPEINSKGNVEKLFGTVKDISDIKETAAKIEQSENRFRLLSNLTFEGIVIHRNGIMLDSNEAFLKMFGYGREELIGKNVVPLIILPEYQEVVRENVKQGYTASYEVKGRTKLGKIIPLEIESRIVVYEGKKARVAALRNISERKKQREILAREQWLFTTLMENIPDSIYFKDLDSRFVRVNRATVVKFGYDKPTDILGKTDFDIFDDEHARAAFKDEQKIIRTGEKIEGKVEKEIWSDGRVKWGFTTKLPLYNEDNKIVGTFGITRDITELKQTQDKVLQERNKFELLFNLAPSAIFTVDNDAVVTSWNSMAEEITGYPAGEVVGNNCLMFAGEPCNESCGLMNDEVPKPVTNAECRIKHKNGSIITVSKNSDYIRNGSGEIIGGIESFVDISKRKEHEEEIKKYSEELKELNLNKDKFFSIIAHDLRNPFVTLLGFSEMLIEDYYEFSDNEKLEYLKEMEKTSRSSYELLENLLQWSRSQTGRIKYKPQNLNLVKKLNEVLAVAEKSSELKNILITSDVGDSVLLYADEDMLMTIFRNLITNALKFTDKGGGIRITAEQDGEFIKCAVIDSGVGMSEKQAENIFELDQTSSTEGTGGEKGSGLGLLLCQEFVRKHGGKIWVDSEKGVGTKFYFTLPKAKK